MIRRLRRSQSGFTLIELLVAVSVGSLVVLASLAVLDMGVTQSGKVFDREDTAQRGRIAMFTIASQLRSQVCLDDATPPIVAGSSPYSVTFYTYTGSGTGGSVAPQLHSISWDTNTQSIVERDWTGSPPDQTLAPNRTTTLLTNVTPPPGSGSPPIFSYYGFATAADGSVSATNLLPATLGSGDLKSVADVRVSFSVFPQKARITTTTPSTTLTQDILSRNANPNDPVGPTAVECTA